MKALELKKIEQIKGGVCAVVAGGGTATGAAAYITGTMKSGAKLGAWGGIKGIIAGAAVGAAAGGMCLLFS